jgi:NADH dehydrogenase
MPRDPTGSERKDMINKSDLVVVGAGFAGVWAAAAAAALRDDIGVAPGDFPITVVSPGGDLVIRPRLYQSEPWRMYAPLDEVLGALGVSRVAATVTGIDSTTQRITVEADDGGRSSLRYGRLVLASGSQVVAPDLPGADRLFDVDTIAAATRLDAHLRRLHAVSARPGREAVVVVGAGFAGIEVATEMVARLQAITTSEQPPRVVLVEAQSVIGPDLGPGPRQVIADALDDVGVEVLLDQRVIEVADGVVVLADGSSIESATIIWTAGMRASGLTRQLGGTQDRLGRVPVDEFLRVNQTPSIFAAGDTAAARGPDGHAVLQSCQHAIPLGKFAGHNAAADLLGQPLQPFDPGPYITCLDLGTAGAVVATGWDREVRLTGESAKAMKKAIVESYIYPPVDDPAVMLAFARARPNLPLPL